MGSRTFDDTTEISTWTTHPDNDLYSDVMVIGGTTKSRDVTETRVPPYNECMYDGCAVVASWINDDWVQRYVYRNMRNVLEFAGNAETMTTIVLMDRIKADEPGVHAYGFGWILWDADVMTFVDEGYQSAYPYDRYNWNNFGNVMLMQEDRLHVVVNGPSGESVTEFWLIFEESDEYSADYPSDYYHATTIQRAFKQDFTLTTYNY